MYAYWTPNIEGTEKPKNEVDESRLIGLIENLTYRNMSW